MKCLICKIYHKNDSPKKDVIKPISLIFPLGMVAIEISQIK